MIRSKQTKIFICIYNTGIKGLPQNKSCFSGKIFKIYQNILFHIWETIGQDIFLDKYLPFCTIQEPTLDSKYLSSKAFVVP